MVSFDHYSFEINRKFNFIFQTTKIVFPNKNNKIYKKQNN